jgi:hypothetical protein
MSLRAINLPEFGQKPGISAKIPKNANKTVEIPAFFLDFNRSKAALC